MTARISYKQGVTSQCIICGRDYYGKKIEKCPRCGGLCSAFTDHDITFLERRQTRGTIVIADKD
jgi:rRNA maturation endonuclease Nob1